MASAEFAALWARADVRQKSGGRKALWHADVGRFDVDYERRCPATSSCSWSTPRCPSARERRP